MRLNSRVWKYFEVRRGLRQGYVMSPRFFNIFFDRVARPVYERATRRECNWEMEREGVLN